MSAPPDPPRPPDPARSVRGDGLSLMTGNQAVAWGVRLAAPDLVPVYPITPQTPILEQLIAFRGAGLFEGEVITPESEHSAMAAAVAASAAGARVFTATSSQGLLLMHELLHYAAGARLPIVLFNVNRTPAAPWGFWPDQTDSLSQRDTGWVQFYSESAQESLDSVVQAFRIAEAAQLPVMLSHDAFYVSHALEPVSLPCEQAVRQVLPAPPPRPVLEPELGRSIAAPASQAAWNRSRREMSAAMALVEALTEAAGQAWGAATGRDGGALELYRSAGAETLFVTMGSLAGTARVAVDRLRAAGLAVGLVRLRLLRPLPLVPLRRALAGCRRALVLDRNYSPGMGGILHQELAAGLCGWQDAPRLAGILAGIGGVDVPVRALERLARDACAEVWPFPDSGPDAGAVWLEDRDAG